MKTESGYIDLSKIFDIRSEEMYKEAWWYWFWLFFFDDPKTKKPRQLMILWSSKNEKEIECNGVKFKLENPLKGNTLKGAVASWYFDGERMHENFLLEQCNIKFSKNKLKSDSSVPTSFCLVDDLGRIRIGDDYEFVVEIEKSLRPTVKRIELLEKSKFTIINGARFNLMGNVNGEPINGSAFLECVFCSIPIPSWYWGIFHFESGAVLNYFNPYLFKAPLLSSIMFYDGKKFHTFDKMKVKEFGGKDRPSFVVSSKNKKEEIKFKVDTYSRAVWKFNKKHPGIIGLIPNTLTYNEYPSSLASFSLKSGKKKLTLGDLGDSVGNAEHTEGFLL